MYIWLILASAAGLAILGVRIIVIGAAKGFMEKCKAIWRCVLDWTISLSLAVVGGGLGGLEVGGPSGLLAGMVISFFFIGWGGSKESRIQG